MFSYDQKKILSRMIWLAIQNGNSAEGKPFNPTPEEYEQLCDMAKAIDDNIRTMKSDYHLD